ncbi:aspartic proteinase nepenthesin [Arachis hypogaea]|nr:aspartic proteinase nepenthesin [Arachis hypogaea]
MVLSSMSSPLPPPPQSLNVVIKIGIGIIDIEGDVAYKSYLLALDTGSDLIWIQCEKCKIQDENHRRAFQAVRGIVIGCGYKNYDDGNAGDAYQITGIFGMSPGPLSFLSQNKPKKFSYCMVPRHVKNPPPTYLRFGSEVKPFTRFQTVDLLMTKATKNHFVLQLEDLGVNGKRLRIDRRRLGNQ